MLMTLETGRLRLRPFRLDDAEAMFSGWASDDEVTKYLTWPTHTSVEIGPRDIENGQCVMVRRNDGEKSFVALSELESAAQEQLRLVYEGMYAKAKKNLDEHIFAASSIEEVKALQEKNGGFIKTMWCGELQCELDRKEKAGMSSRCMPLEQESLSEVCACCGKPAKHMIYWGVAY